MDPPKKPSSAATSPPSAPDTRAGYVQDGPNLGGVGLPPLIFAVFIEMAKLGLLHEGLFTASLVS